jgi:hypothetical protein
MAKSKKRGGDKQHRKRIQARNQNIKGLWQRLTNKAYEKHEEWKKEQSGSTIN